MFLPNGETHEWTRRKTWTWASTNNTWTANPATDGSHDPSFFMNAAYNAIITPTNSDTTLYPGAGSGFNDLTGAYHVDYSTGSGVVLHSNSGNNASATKKCHCNFW